MELNYSYTHLICGISAILIGLMYFYPIIFYIFLFLLYSMILVFIVLFVQYNKNKPTSVARPVAASNILYNVCRSRMFDSPKRNKASLPVIFGRSVDSLIHQILENILNDFVAFWLSKIVHDPKNIMDVIKEDIWIATQKMIDRLRKVDAPKILAVDFVLKITNHLEKIRIMKENNVTILQKSSYLTSEDKEIEFLKKISEIVIIMLLPRGYSIAPLKDLLCEIIAFKLFYSTIKMVTSPDYINQKIVDVIQSKLASIALSRRSYEYASSYQDFLKIINNSSSVDELLQMRTSIINDIMQATTSQNIQRAKGIDIDSAASTASLKRSDINAAMKLKRYIQQMSFAKSQCEKNLTKLGWVGNFSNDLNLSLLDILSTVVGRKYFIIFLESLNAGNLVGFYTTVEELKNSLKPNVQQLGAEIYYTYIRPNFEIKLEKGEQKKVEAFLMGDDSSHEVFFEVQKNVLKLLEEKYYQPFILSNEYQNLKNSITSEDLKDISVGPVKSGSSEGSSTEEDSENSYEYDTGMDLANHSTYAQNKLEQLQEKLKNKKNAFVALKSSVKPEAQVLTVVEKEIENLKHEKRQLEAHLLRTETWTENLGKWRATVESVEKPEDKETPEFLIVVQVDEMPKEAKEDEVYDTDENISTGWVVLRTLVDFHELHKKIRPICTELKSLDLPSNNSFILFFGKNDKMSLDKAKSQIQRYLNFILENPKIVESEFLYAFLSPSTDKLKQMAPSPKKGKFFSLSTLFRTGSSSSDRSEFWGLREGSNEDDDDSLLSTDNNEVSANGDHKDNKAQLDPDSKDSIAEPIYGLMSEIFDLTGPFKFLRKSLISFVQITCGSTLNRQIRDLISNCFDESNLHHFSSNLLKSLWPAGSLAKPVPERTDDMKEMTSIAAKSLIIDNIPDLLSNLVGAQNAKNGSIKIFEILQNEEYNKQLVYDMLEVLMVEIFPEIKQLPQQHQSNRNNQK